MGKHQKYNSFFPFWVKITYRPFSYPRPGKSRKKQVTSYWALQHYDRALLLPLIKNSGIRLTSNQNTHTHIYINRSI